MRRVLTLCRYSLMSMALGSLPLILTPQGRDLITALGDAASVRQRIFFYLTLALWGLSVWSSRVVLDAEYAQTGQPYPPLARRLPRWLGALTLLLPAFPVWLASSSVPTKALLSLGCVSLAALFCVFVAYRRAWLTAHRDGFALHSFSVSNARTKPAGRIAALSLTISAALFVWFVAAPLSAGAALGAVAIAFMAAANTVFFGSLAVFVSNKTRFHIDVAALALAAVFSFWNDNHDVAVASAPRPPSVQTVFSTWLTQLHLPAREEGTPPSRVFVVAAEGGGIRAAYWTGTALSDLADRYPEFGQRLFAVSGISGGSLGAAVYAALRHDAVRPPSLRARMTSALNRADLLAPILAKMVTGDFLQWFVPFPVHAFDRSTAMEDGMAAMYGRTGPGAANPFTDSVFALRPDADSGVPALVFNSTGVESGGRVIMAPFTWEENDIPDTTSYFKQAGGGAPTLAAAVHNSARFTYVSPAGLIRTVNGKHRGHVVDGGYFDPSGVDTLLDIVHALDPIASAAGVEIVSVYLTNGRIPKDSNKAVLAYGGAVNPPPPASDAPVNLDEDTQPATDSANAALYRGELRGFTLLGNLSAPVQALLATRAAHARVAIGREREARSVIAFGFCRNEEPLRPPLGWQLSQTMMDQLTDYWDNCPVNQAGRLALSALVHQPAVADKPSSR